MANFGFKISQEGIDVKTATNEELVMSSSFNMMKTLAVGLTVGASNVAHGRAYIPIFFTSVQSGSTGTIIGDDRTTRCDATNLILPATTKYYLFYQSGT